MEVEKNEGRGGGEGGGGGKEGQKEYVQKTATEKNNYLHTKIEQK